MWQRFTERARKVVFYAQEEAGRLGENYVSTEHLLLGLVRESDSVAARILDRVGVPLERIRTEIERQVAWGDGRLGQDMQLTPRAKRVIDLAYDEARQLNNNYIGTEHLLLGLVREGEGLAGRVLSKLSVDLDRARREVMSLQAGGGHPNEQELQTRKLRRRDKEAQVLEKKRRDDWVKEREIDMKAPRNDQVSLVKRDGRQHEPVPAWIGPESILIDDVILPIEEGDFLERLLPSGLKERFLVTDRGYFSPLETIPAHYQVRVQKEVVAPQNHATPLSNDSGNSVSENKRVKRPVRKPEVLVKPRVFIGSSKESLAYAYSVQKNLSDAAECTVWDQGIFQLSSYPLEALTAALDNTDFGVFIFAPDDMTRLRGAQYQSVRDNVVFELGLFMGRLGRSHTFVLMPNVAGKMHILSDLSALTFGMFDPNRADKNLRAALGPACNDIAAAIQRLSVTPGDLADPKTVLPT